MDFSLILIKTLKESFVITLIILFLMIVVEIIVLKSKDKLISFLNKNRFLSYVVSSFFGIIPGCSGTFIMDSLYMTGLLSFGGIIAVMIATSGDEMFLILSMAAKGEIEWMIVIGLIAFLFVLGIISGFIADYFKNKAKMSFCEKCIIKRHKDEFGIKHFIKEHVYEHIFKKHIWKIFLWIFSTILVISVLEELIDLNSLFTTINPFYLLFIAVLIGIIPLSGPNVFLIVLFSKGLIPLSIVLANSIVQDGHGLLPIIGFSVKDALKIKVFNLFFGLLIGLLLLVVGF